MVIIMLVSNYEELITMMQENPVVVDDHTDEEMKLTGLVEFDVPNKGLACCFDARYYSLNLCYIGDDDSKLHCSQLSIAGVLWGAEPDSEQLKRYNDDVVFGAKIKCIHRPDGTKVHPA